MMNLIKLHKYERTSALLAAIFIILLNTLNVLKYYDRFSQVQEKYHDWFWNTYHVSGYDLHTYVTVSSWDVLYEVTRHPLMAFYMYVPAKINDILISLTGSNWATVIVGILWALCAFYAFIFLFRILHELQGLDVLMSNLLCALFCSLGFTMVSIFVPDHFGPSEMLLLLTIYIIGKRIKENKEISSWHTIILFILTAGVSLNNGIKVFLAAWINKGRSFFKPKYMAYSVILPSILIFCFAQLEHYIFVQPKIEATKQARIQADREWRAGIRQTYCDTTIIQDSAEIDVAVKAIIRREILNKYHDDHLKPWNQHKAKALAKTGFMSWTDVSTPRWQSLVENVFGEPIQMHEDHFLEDVNLGRPIILKYNHWYNYMAEAILVLLMLAGFLVGRHQKVIWMVLSFFAFDMLIHLGLGFGLNEVYIMSPHYLFMIPIVIAPLLATKKEAATSVTAYIVLVLTIWFAYWNIRLLLPFLS